MPTDPRAPVIIGAGQYVHRAASVDDGVEPATLLVEAVDAARADAGLATLPRSVDSIRVVNLLSWRYGNPAWVVARRLGVEAGELAYTTAGGNSPQALVNRTALDIAAGRADLVVLAGGEAWRTRMRVRQSGTIVDWEKAPETATPVTIGDELDMTHPAEAARGIYLPVQVYPMFETAIRAAARTPPDEHVAETAELWSRFSAVAATNPVRLDASADVRRGDRHGDPAEPHRRVAVPQGDERQQRRRHGGGAHHVLGRAGRRASASRATAGCSPTPAPTATSTPTCRTGGRSPRRRPSASAARRALELAGVGIDDIAFVDLYSCFPSAVRLGAASVGLDLAAQLTRTGGLSFAGGPWNNYVMHAIATIVAELRDQRQRAGARVGQRRLPDEALVRRLRRSTAGRGFRHDQPQAGSTACPPARSPRATTRGRRRSRRTR